MVAEFSLTLPLPTSVNRLYIGQGKSKRKHPNYSAWCNEAGWRVNEARSAGSYRPLTAGGWYWCVVLLPIDHEGDSDNRLKAVHDLLVEMGSTPDDKWLFGGTYMRSANVAPGTCEVHAISLPCGEIGPDEFQFIAQHMGFGLLASGSTEIPLEGAIR